jgi:DnaA-homolog protein
MRSKPIAARVTSARPSEQPAFQDKDKPWNRLPVQRQLTLDLGTPPPATFDNFFAAGNHELVTRLRELDGALASGPVADRTFYIWGEAGSGRTHLLQALVHETNGRARFLGPKTPLADFTFDPAATLYAIDDCDRLSGAQQIALFNLFNEVRAHPSSALVATGNVAPLGMSVREDLRTRLGWGLVFQLLPLTDEGKAAVLKHAARERGIALANDVPAYLLTHYRRDMPSLMALLDELDRFSLEQKRAITLQLLKAMLNAKEDETPLQQQDLFGNPQENPQDRAQHHSLDPLDDAAPAENASTRFK